MMLHHNTIRTAIKQRDIRAARCTAGRRTDDVAA